MTMQNDIAIEPTWITAARAATAEQAAAEVERQRQYAAEQAASQRRTFLDLLTQCGVPVDRVVLINDPTYRLVAAVDGYRFVREHDGWAINRLLECPACQQTLVANYYATPGSGNLGALLDDPEPRYHRCPGRPVGPEDYDEEGELIDRTPRPSPPPPPPSTGEKLLAALAEYIAEQGAGE